MNKGKLKPGVISWLMEKLKTQKLSVFLLTVLGVLVSLLAVLRAYCYREIIDLIKPVSYGLMKDELSKWIIFFIAIVIATVLLSLLSNYIKEFSLVSILNKIRKEIITSVYKKDYSKISEFHSGDILNRVFSDARIISNNVISLAPSFFALSVRLIGSFVFMYMISPAIALILLFAGLVLSGISLLFKKKAKKLHKETQKAEGDVRSVFQEQATGLLMIKVFSAERLMEEKADAAQKIYKNKHMHQKLFSCILGFVHLSAYNFALVIVFLYSIYAIMNGTMGYGSLTAMLQLANSIQSSLNEISGIVPRIYSTTASGERIIEILDLPEEKEALHPDISFEKIVFDNVSFTYGRNDVLKEVTFNVDKNEIIGIQGPSGIGKSTILLLLLGIYNPTEGKIYLKEGVFETEICKDTRTLFSYIPQGNLLFSGTIRENILFANENATDEEIKNALKISCSSDFIDELPLGIDTKIGEGGHGLSEGQQQRIAIARAIVSNSEIMLFDEATSALDEATESKLINNLRGINKTCVIVTHRKSALSICDSSYVLSEEGFDKIK